MNCPRHERQDISGRGSWGKAWNSSAPTLFPKRLGLVRGSCSIKLLQERGGVHLPGRLISLVPYPSRSMGEKKPSNPTKVRPWQQLWTCRSPTPSTQLPTLAPPTTISSHFTSTDFGRKGSLMRSPREDSCGGGGCPGGCW